MLQHPNVILEVVLVAGYFLGADAAGSAMDRELQGVIGEPGASLGIRGGEKIVTAHGRMEPPAGSPNNDGSFSEKRNFARKPAGNNSPFLMGSKPTPVFYLPSRKFSRGQSENIAALPGSLPGAGKNFFYVP